MITLKEITQWFIRKESATIHQLKTATIKRERLKKFAYISPDGKTYRKKLPIEAARLTGWYWDEIEYERISGHISPKHLDWQQYQQAQQRASLLLTMRVILKLGNEALPSIEVVIKALREHQLSHHAQRGRARALVVKAYRYLRKLDNRLKNQPTRFAEIAALLAQPRSSVADEHGSVSSSIIASTGEDNRG